MIATDELRRLLDERGVAWHHTSGSLGIPYTWWHSPTMGEVDATEGADGKLYMVLNLDLTPEQAVEATLGSGTCHITVEDNLAETEGMGDVWLECSACHWQMPLEPTTPLFGYCPPLFNYCPNCGRKVVDA